MFRFGRSVRQKDSVEASCSPETWPRLLESDDAFFIPIGIHPGNRLRSLHGLTIAVRPLRTTLDTERPSIMFHTTGARRNPVQARRRSKGYKPVLDQSLESRMLLSGSDPTALSIGVNIPQTTYYSSSMTFNDAMKYSSGWYVSNGTSWTDGSQPLPAMDQDGYPLQVSSLTDRGYYLRTNPFLQDNNAYPEGNYTLTFDGTGTLTINGGSSQKSFTQKGNAPQTYVVPVTHSPFGISVTFTADDPADHIRNVHLIMPGYENTYQTNPFTTQFLNDLKPFSTLRFMDAMNSNAQFMTSWSQRSTATDMTQAGSAGMAVEYMVDLANLTHENPWFNMPAEADDNYVRQFSEYVRDHLDPGLKAYVEYSNETWNGTFPQYAYVDAYANSHGLADAQAVADLESHVWGIWSDTLAGQTSRMVRVAASQAVNPSLLDVQIVELVKDSAPDDPNHGFDIVSGAPYFDPNDSSYNANTTTAQIVADTEASIASAMTTGVDPFMAAVKKWEQTLGRTIPDYCYEGGTGIAPPYPSSYYSAAIAVQNDPGMYSVVQDYLAALRAHGVSGINYFNLSTTPSSYGEFGLEEYLGESASLAPKYAAVANFVKSQAPDIQGVAVSQRTSGGFTVSWTGGTQTSARIDYGTTTGYGESVTSGSTFDLDHQVTITGLTPNLLYHFRVTVTDKYGNQTVSGDQTASTDVTLPVISRTPTLWYDGGAATLTWITDKPSTSFVDYGQGTTTTQIGNAALTTFHTVTLPGLVAGATYHYQVESTDVDGNTVTTPSVTYSTAPIASRTIFDDSGPNYQGTSTANLVVPGAGYGGNYHVGIEGEAQNVLGTWTTNVAPGRYRVSVTWQQYAMPFGNNMGTVTYNVMDKSRVLAAVNVNQGRLPGDFTDSGASWKILGDFSSDDGALSVVESDVYSTVNHFVTTDAVSLILLSAAAPTVSAPSLVPASTSGGQPTVVGTAAPGTNVQLILDSSSLPAATGGAPIGPSVVAGADGSYQFALPGSLVAASYSFHVEVSDGKGDTAAGPSVSFRPTKILNSPTIPITPDGVTQFVVSAPPNVPVGQSFSVTVTAEDQAGNVVTTYRGTISLGSSSTFAGLPTSYTFNPADQGVHSFLGVISQTAGSESITATDSTVTQVAGTTSIGVSPLNPTSFSAVNGSGSFGGTATFSATLLGGTTPMVGQLVNFSVNVGGRALNVGSATTNANGVATLAGVSLAGQSAGTIGGAVTASFAGDSNDAAGSATGTLTVNRIAPTITWANPAAITYNTALGSSQLDAQANVPGTFTYSQGPGTILGVGNQAITLTFAPTDSVDYLTTTASATLAVSRATPAITWPTPSTINAGTALGKTQLDATATLGGAAVPGVFTYASPVGTVFKVGQNQVLSVTFTPTDSVDELPATATTTINVVLAPTSVSLSSATTSTQLGQPAKFVVVVSPQGGSAAPTGTVTFFDGSTVLGSATLDSTGHATLAATSGLKLGTQAITAGYSGDSVDATSTSASLSLYVGGGVKDDYDGDGKADMAVYGKDLATGKYRFEVLTSSTNFNPSAAITFNNNGYGFGNSRSIPVPGDYFGEGRDAYAVWTPNALGGMTLAVISSVSSKNFAVNFGGTNDVPVVADVDGDGKADFGVYGFQQGLGYRFDFLLSSANFDPTHQEVFNNNGYGYGNARSIPVVADFDGSGKAGFGLYNPSPSGSNFAYVSQSGKVAFIKTVGTQNDIPMAVDYDGDGKADLALFGPDPAKPGHSRFEVLTSGSNYDPSKVAFFDNNGYGYGNAQSVPVMADTEGDGQANFNLYTPDNKGGMELIFPMSKTGQVAIGDFATLTDIALSEPSYLIAKKVRGF